MEFTKSELTVLRIVADERLKSIKLGRDPTLSGPGIQALRSAHAKLFEADYSISELNAEKHRAERPVSSSKKKF